VGGLMSKEFHSIGSKRCCTCLQWEGSKEVVPEKGIRSDAQQEANCRVLRKLVRGGYKCKEYLALK